eukprot:5596436-Alexandrium_andersonii.AAC.1
MPAGTQPGQLQRAPTQWERRRQAIQSRPCWCQPRDPAWAEEEGQRHRAAESAGWPRASARPGGAGPGAAC